MNTATPNPKGLTYAQHFRLAIELSIARHKIFHINNALVISYPQTIYGKLPDIKDDIEWLGQKLENKLYQEYRPNIPTCATDIYTSGLGYKLAHFCGFDFSIIKPTTDSKRNRKTRLTSEQYIKVLNRLAETRDLASLIGMVVSATYGGSATLNSYVKKLQYTIDSYQRKLIQLLKKEHGPDHEMFSFLLHRMFLNHSFTDLTFARSHIAHHIEALLKGNIKTLTEIESELKEKKKATRPTNANRPAGLQ